MMIRNRIVFAISLRETLFLLCGTSCELRGTLCNKLFHEVSRRKTKAKTTIEQLNNWTIEQLNNWTIEPWNPALRHTSTCFDKLSIKAQGSWNTETPEWATRRRGDRARETLNKEPWTWNAKRETLKPAQRNETLKHPKQIINHLFFKIIKTCILCMF
jgi:hypothetical protein